MELRSIECRIHGETHFAQAKLFKSGSTGYFFSGKLYIEGVKHTLQITMVEVGSGAARKERLEKQPEQLDDTVTLYTASGQEVDIPASTSHLYKSTPAEKTPQRPLDATKPATQAHPPKQVKKRQKRS